MNLETYGKQSIFVRKYLQLRNRFRITETEKKYCKFETYVPRLNKTRFAIGTTGALVFVALPFVTPLALPCVEWAIK